MNDELRERLNAFRALSAFASSEDVQWLVDRVEEAEARAADLADRELTALRTMEKAIKELADRDAKLAAVEALHQPGAEIRVMTYNADSGLTYRDARRCDGCSKGDGLDADFVEWPCATAAALADAKLAAVLSECERADDTMRRQYAERNGYGAVPNALEVAALSRLVTAKVRELATDSALSLSVPTSPATETKD